MSRAAQKLIAASGSKDAYEIEQSLMFEDGDTAYLTKTPSSAGNRKTWTYSCWVKRSEESGSAYYTLFSACDNSSANTNWIAFRNNELAISAADGNVLLRTNALYRDISAWYHCVFVYDSTQSTESNRMKIFVNGVQITSFAAATYPSQNDDGFIGSDVQHNIGTRTRPADTRNNYYSGYMAETHFIDGSQLTASSFGETDAATGQWIPKKYTGSYGTNGFYLKFVSGALGTDSSGEGNNYTATNLANGDVMLDTPTNNFCTLDIGDTGSYTTLSQGALKSEGNTSADAGWTHSTMVMMDGSGKWYSEHRLVTKDSAWPSVAVSRVDDGYYNGTLLTSRFYPDYCRIRMDGTVDEWQTAFTEQSGMDLGSALSDGDIINVAVDTDNKKVWFGVNGTWNGSGDPAAGSNPTFTYTAASDLVFSHQHLKDSATSTLRSNFGQDGTFNGAITAAGNSDGNEVGNFKYSVPSGFLALCASNISTPGIKKPTDHFNTVLYTGNGSTQNITGVGFQPDLVWIKNRSASDNHKLTDAVRGVTKEIESNTNDIEATNDDGLTAFGSDGFSLGDDDEYNTNTETYVSWNWKANGSGSSNEDGSINTTATSANTTSGFSVSTYTGTGSNATVGHGLGVAPSAIIIKNRGVADDWAVYTSVTDETDYLVLNSTAAATDDNAYWNDTAPTSSVFSIGTSHSVNASSETYVAYCFVQIAGFSKFGKYLGNGNANGSVIRLGFRPAFIMLKKSSSSGSSWFMWDNKRDPTNVAGVNTMWADLTTDDDYSSTYLVDFLANGFKLRGTNTGTNSSGQTITYLAFAKSPFSYSNAR